MKKKVTLKQIAKELDVSISTVSKALKNSIEISEDTRQKVQAFAKLYNYRLVFFRWYEINQLGVFFLL